MIRGSKAAGGCGFFGRSGSRSPQSLGAERRGPKGYGPACGGVVSRAARERPTVGSTSTGSHRPGARRCSYPTGSLRTSKDLRSESHTPPRIGFEEMMRQRPELDLRVAGRDFDRYLGEGPNTRSIRPKCAVLPR